MAIKNLTSGAVFAQLTVPAVVTGTGSFVETTNRVDVRGEEFATVLVAVGAMAASTTLDAKLTQSNAATSGTSKDLGTVALTQVLTASGASKVYAFEIRTTQLDSANGFYWLSLSHKITNTNTTALDVIAILTSARTAPVTSGLTQTVTLFTTN